MKVEYAVCAAFGFVGDGLGGFSKDSVNKGDPGFPPKCPAGEEIKTVDECYAAGLADGGVLRNGAVVVSDWAFTPCGCFISVGGDKAIHFDTGSANCVASVDFEP